MRATAISLLFAISLVTPSLAQSYRIDWYSINSGGGLATGGGYKLNSTIGQPTAGLVKNTSFLHWIGFWAGEVPVPTVAGSVAAAKALPDGAFVSLVGRVATSAEADFAGFFYVEDADRVSGIRVALPSGGVPGLARGSVVNVIGNLGTTSSGERLFTGPVVVITGMVAPLAPVGMPNRSLGGGDAGSPPLGQYGVAGGAGLNNVGLLVQTWGRVIDAGSGYVVIDDGSATPVRMDTSTLANPPALNEHVSVIGISSIHKPAAERLRLVLPRDDSDIAAH